jgi:hypothetical protein
MYGEGFDFPPLYAPFPGNVVGALPVGLQTRGDHDIPYWPVQSTWTYKEAWVHPVARWIWLMRDLAGPAVVEGQAGSLVRFVPSGPEPQPAIQVIPTNGRFRAMLPEGKYTVRCNGEERSHVFLPAGKYDLDFRPGRSFDFELSKQTSADGEVRIGLSARGEGRHRFSIRADNLTFPDAAKELILKRGGAGTLDWSGKISSQDKPWVAVVVADESPAIRREIIGAAWEP